MKIVFQGENAASFSGGFGDLLDHKAEIIVLPGPLDGAADRRAYATADVVVSTQYDEGLPKPEALTLFHVPAAGYDKVDLDAVPGSAVICNCFGHEQAIAEYVMAALLARHVPLADADRRLREKDWAYWAGSPERAHDEMAEKTVGLLGFGHIGQAIAARAKAFEMGVSVANRSPVAPSALVDRAFTLDRLDEFWRSADFFIVSLPLTEETKGIVGARAFAAMPRHAVVVNVGRGPTIDEQALYDALRSERIAGAIIDTWYAYPAPGQPAPHPASLPFHTLTNIVMTPHMSGWTRGTIRRRQRTIAENVRRRTQGLPCINVVRPASA